MRLDARGEGSRLRVRRMAGQTERVAVRAKHSDVVVAMRIVAGKAGHAARVHYALDEIVALHPILVRRTVGEVREARLTWFVRFERPKIGKRRTVGRSPMRSIKSASNQVLPKASAIVSCRIVPDQDPDEVFDQVKAVLTRDPPWGVKVTVKPHGERKGLAGLAKPAPRSITMGRDLTAGRRHSRTERSSA